MTRKALKYTNSTAKAATPLWSQFSGFSILIVVALFVMAHVRSFEQGNFVEGGVSGTELLVVAIASAITAAIGVLLTSQTRSRMALSHILLAVAVAIPVIDLGSNLAVSFFLT